MRRRGGGQEPKVNGTHEGEGGIAPLDVAIFYRFGGLGKVGKYQG